MIEASGLRYQAQGSGARLLRDIDLRVFRGERIGLVGPSGSGKTTLGYHLCGVHALALGGRSSGSLRLDGREAIRGGPRGFGGMVLQNPETQLFGRRVEEEVALGLPAGSSEAELARLLERTGLAPLRRREVAGLSLGWKQRLSIAGMLAMNPKVLLLDEPTNFLDGGAADALFGLLGEMGDRTVIVADHDEARLAGWANRILRLEDGSLVQDLPAGAYCCAPPLAVRTGAREPGGLLLEFQAVHFAYRRNHPVLRGNSLELREGEAVALLGLNGSGKTTLLRLAKGLLKPASGTIRTASGRPLMKEVGLVFQNPDEALFAPTVLAECAFLPANLRLPHPEARAREVLERFGLGALAGRAPFTLSFGEKRRVSLASVLSGGARILCLDEPTVGLDRDSLERLAAMLREHTTLGGGVIFATHDKAFAAAVATRTLSMEDLP